MPDVRQQFERYIPLLKQNWLPLALGCFGLIFFIYGLIALLGSSSDKSTLEFQPANSLSDNTQAKQNIIVDIEGGVVKPGIYSLPLGSRIQDILVLASGLSEKADRSWVEKNLNLAAKLTDGAKIYIPRLNEPQNQATNIVQGQGLGAQVLGQSSLINVNSASVSELDTLPGVGPVTADKIIANRPYQSVDELLSKKSVNSKVFSQIKDKITAN